MIWFLTTSLNLSSLSPLLTMPRGAWVAQLVGLPTSAQVTISLVVSSSPMLGSVLTTQRLEPASDSVCLSVPPPLVLCVCVCVCVCVSQK